MSAPLLVIDDLHAGYGASTVIRGVSIEVRSGEAVGLLGPNGHGKTTLLRTVSALHPPSRGDIRFEGRSILRHTPRQILRQGIVHVPQGSRLFPRLSVADSLRLGAGAGRAGRESKRLLNEVYDLFPKLQQRQRQLAGTLSGGERQMLSIGIGMMSAPRLLILDEPTLGLSPKVKHELAAAVAQLRARLEAVILVDGDMDLVLNATDRYYVIESGLVASSGQSAAGASSDEMMSLFLGDA